MVILLKSFLLIIPCYSVEFPSQKVLLVRHGEKDAKSKTGDVHLNSLGKMRSHALAQLFFPNSHNRSLNDFDIPIPSVNLVIAQNATEMYPSRRKIETAEPISQAGRVALALYDHEDLLGLCSRIRSEVQGGNVPLVVWDHSTVGYVADDLLAVPRGTIRWPMDRYDVIWEIDLQQKRLLQFCQHLLFGDLWCPVNPIQVFPFFEGVESLLSAETSTHLVA